MCVYVHGDAGRERACTQKTSIHVYILVACTQKTSIHVYILVYIDTCIHTCIHVYIYRAKNKKKGVNGLGTTNHVGRVLCVCVHLRVCISMYVYISMCVYIHVCIFLCVNIYLCVCVYISMCVYIYVCTHPCRPSLSAKKSFTKKKKRCGWAWKHCGQPLGMRVCRDWNERHGASSRSR